MTAQVEGAPAAELVARLERGELLCGAVVGGVTGRGVERWGVVRFGIPELVGMDRYAILQYLGELRAVRLEKELQTPAHIYYKYEGVSPAGSHKPNSAVAQAYYKQVRDAVGPKPGKAGLEILRRG